MTKVYLRVILWSFETRRVFVQNPSIYNTRIDEEPEQEVIDVEKEEVDKINEMLDKSVDELEPSLP